ncbi:MAG: alpha-galactosidase [Clostridia bacterium]|nr:alpha-galactosidase [Clostridia bacterium]
MLNGILKAAAAVAAAAGIGYAIKGNRIDPAAAAARTVNAAKVTTKSQTAYDNGVALTPPMGWSSWNTFRNKINEELILEIANAMAKSGLADAGYQYVNLDDCWQSSQRDENDRFIADYEAFPRGIKPLVEDINKLGLKVGIYSSNGTHTCEDLPASLGYEAIDAATFAEWGIEYFKYDFCHSKPIPTSAPYIEKLIISTNDGTEIASFNAKDATLEGHARLASDSKHPEEYIVGLSSNIGSATFSGINVEEDGNYVITLIIRKKGLFYKYARVEVNGDTEYDLYAAPTKASTSDGRLQLTIRLNKGENSVKFYNPFASRMDAAACQYIRMGRELRKATKEYAEKNGTEEKPICYSICEWGFNRPWNWGKEAGNLWRTTLDITATWPSIISIYEQNVRLARHAGPGGWNDPDMLEVGNGELSMDENIAHFSVWCMMAAPLILGNDIRRFIDENGNAKTDDPILQILTNKDLIAIDQDKLGVQCRRHKTNLKVDVLVKPLENNELAICFFNKFGEEACESVSISELLATDYCDLPVADKYVCTDLWSKEEFIAIDTIGATIAPHSVKVYRIKVKEG